MEALSAAVVRWHYSRGALSFVAQSGRGTDADICELFLQPLNAAILLTNGRTRGFAGVAVEVRRLRESPSLCGVQDQSLDQHPAGA